jgi:release factor glutamine methyltransferase
MVCSDGKSAAMTRAELLLYASSRLKKAGWEDSHSLAERLLMHALDVPRYRLYIHADMPVVGEGEKRFNRMLARSVKGEPLQYVTGSVEFYGIELGVRPGVLIPRPETELLVDHAKRVSGDGIRRAMDIGCGSGAITLSLFEQRIAQEIVAVDVSLSAIQTTATNASSLGFHPADPDTEVLARNLPENVILLHRSSLNPATRMEHRDRLWLVVEDAFSDNFRPPIHPFPLILSNPPYVSSDEWDNLPPHVRDHEPRVALESGSDGLDAHRNLAKRVKDWLSTGGAFIGEIGFEQGEQARKIHDDWAKRTELHKDYSDLDRFVIAFK